MNVIFLGETLLVLLLKCKITIIIINYLFIYYYHMITTIFFKYNIIISLYRF